MGIEVNHPGLRYHGGVELGPDVARIAGLMGDPARAAILVALVGGRALPAGELAFIGNVAPQTASFHLHKLLDASLLSVERQGKHSYYRLANERVAAALEAIAALTPMPDPGSRSRCRPESERVRQLRFARSCYQHLAGMLAVSLHQKLRDDALLIADSETSFCLTDRGRECFRQWGAILPSCRNQQKLSSRACLDWTERRHHLGGALGAALFARLAELRWVVRNPESRAVRVTHAGTRGLEQSFGVRIPRDLAQL